MNLNGQTRCTVSHQAPSAGGRARFGPDACRRKFLRFFPKGFRDQKYVDWERDYKWSAHQRWQTELGQSQFKHLLKQDAHLEIARRAVAIESRTNLLFSFEKMALRDAVRGPVGAAVFANGLFEFLHGRLEDDEARFTRWAN